MIGKVCRRGSDVRRLLGYLFREGLAVEHGLGAPHIDAHPIAANRIGLAPRGEEEAVRWIAVRPR